MSLPTTRVRVKVSGDYACMSRPESKVERVSYECLTPSAARNILDSICWRPQMRWIVDNVQLLSVIRYESIRRNELQSKIAPGNVKKWMSDAATFQPQLAGAGDGTDGTPRNSLVLKNVKYIIEAHPHVYAPTAEDTPTKYMAMFNRRVEKGQCYQQPYLGCREFAARFEPVEESDKPLDISIDLGRMLYDIMFRPGNNTAVFFEARIEKGVLDTRPERAIPDEALREELLACSYKH